MSDPKNIPLSEARPGDKVFLKPATVQATRADILTIKLASEWCYDVSADEIDRIERAPRPLEVGDRVRKYGGEGTVEALHGVVAWVHWDQYVTPCTERVADLERVDG